MSLESVPPPESRDLPLEEMARQRFREKVGQAGFEDVIDISEKDPNLGGVLLMYAMIEVAKETGHTTEEVFDKVFPPEPGEEIEPLGKDATTGEKLERRFRLVENIPELDTPDDEHAKGLNMKRALEEKTKKD